MNMSCIRSIATFAAMLGLATQSIATSDHEGSDEHGRSVAVTHQGAVRGAINATTITFFGIPFAAPPTGPLRWRPPVPANAWAGTLDGTKFRNHCLQEGTPTDPNASEDCLYLNVYAPRNSAHELPVMVWIYGGANAVGASDFYDPTPIVETGHVMVVTVNYRVGAMGFLAHPALDAEGHASVNYGVMDQQAALKWVKENIAAFGGNPENVTIFGESAGGLDSTTHVVSPLSKGLFERVIIESGAYTLNTPSLAASEARGVVFANNIGCTDQTAACLRSKSAADVLANEGTVNTATAAYNQSTVDGQVLPETQRSALNAGRVNRVYVMQGNNRHEGRIFTSPALTAAAAQATIAAFGATAGRTPAESNATYPLSSYPSPFEAASTVLGDAFFACSALASNQLLAQWVPRLFAYEFADEAASPLGATHGAEIKYLFNVTQSGAGGGPASLPAPSQQLASAMRQYWTNFARQGNPNGDDLPYWKHYEGLNDTIQLLVPPIPGVERTSIFNSVHKCAFWGESPTSVIRADD